jgi:hypothetical protein
MVSMAHDAISHEWSAAIVRERRAHAIAHGAANARRPIAVRMAACGAAAGVRLQKSFFE